MTVIEAKSQREIEEFIGFPFSLYRDDPFYSPELIRDQREHLSDKNPFFRHSKVKYFLIKAGGETLGRVASIVNLLHNEYHMEKTGFFGFYESVDSREAASGLLGAVSEDLRYAGMERMRGPMNFSTNEQCGFLVEGFDTPPMLLTPYNPAYYSVLMSDCGLEKVKDLLAYIRTLPEELPDKVMRVAEIAERRGIRVREVQKKRFIEELMVFKEIYNRAWAENWGFVPMTDEELKYMGRRLKPVVVTRLTLIAEKDGEPVGFLGLLPDFNLVLRSMKGRLTPSSILRAFLNYKKMRDLRLLLLGVTPFYRRRGVDALMFREAFKYIKGRYDRVEFSWILEYNEPTKRLVEMIEGTEYKRYRIYEKAL